jgi:hypothetical protein
MVVREESTKAFHVNKVPYGSQASSDTNILHVRAPSPLDMSMNSIKYNGMNQNIAIFTYKNDHSYDFLD